MPDDAIDEQIAQLEARKQKLQHLMKLAKEVGKLERRLILGEDEARVVVRTITDIVCARFDLSVETITGRNREERIARPRQIIYYLANRLGGVGWSQIGRAIGKDHGTVLLGSARVSNLIDTDPKFKATVAELEVAARLALEKLSQRDVPVETPARAKGERTAL